MKGNANKEFVLTPSCRHQFFASFFEVTHDDWPDTGNAGNDLKQRWHLHLFCDDSHTETGFRDHPVTVY